MTTTQPQAEGHEIGGRSGAVQTRLAIVLGGGVAGLTVAWRLAQAPGPAWAPVVLEGEARTGGLARRLNFKGVSTDMGPHRIHTEIPEVARIIEEIAAPSLFTVKRTSHIYLRGHFLQYPPSPLEMTRRLGPVAMGRFGLGYMLERLRPAPRVETYESIMRRAFGRELYEFLLRPYTAKMWKVDPAQLHADTARVRVSAGSLAKMARGLLGGERKGSETALKEFRYVRGGAETLVRHLREHAEGAGAEIRVDAAVERLELDAIGRVTAAVLPGGVRVEGDAFFSTVPLPVLLNRLLPEVASLRAARRAAEGLTYLNMSFICLIVRRKSIRADNWLYFPEPHLIFNRAYEAKNMDPEMSPGERTVMCFEITHQPGDAAERESDAALTAEVVRQAAEVGLFGAGEVEDSFVHRLPYAYPLYSLDYDQRLETAFAGLATIPNLITLGRQGLFNHNNMDHSIFMGLKAAEAFAGAGGDPARAVAAWYGGADVFKRMRIVD